MANIGNVAYVPDLEALVEQVAVNNVETGERPAIAQVNVAVHGRPTYVKANVAFRDRGKDFLLSGKAVLEL